jgi:hypothetical protein
MFRLFLARKLLFAQQPEHLYFGTRKEPIELQYSDDYLAELLGKRIALHPVLRQVLRTATGCFDLDGPVGI